MGILEGKVAIVTGAGKGIGKGVALALAKEGANVVVLARTFADVAQTAKDIEQIGGRALPLQCDVCVRDQVETAVADTVKAFGTVDILVNNAQIIVAPRPLEEWTEEDMRSQYDSGVLGSWFFMVACLPYMKQKGGRIVNTCSAAGHGIIPGFGGYSVAKEGVRSLTRVAAREWGKYGINVNAISPIAFSDAARRLFPTDELLQEQVRSQGCVLPNLIGDAEKDIGRGVVYLVGPDSRQITGMTLSLDAGCAML